MNATIQDLQVWHERLHKRYDALAAEAPGRQIYALEHGLGEPDRSQLISEVASYAKERPFDDESWNDVRLPLIVFASEFGFTYQGHGKHYWPLLAEEIGLSEGVAIKVAARHAMRGHFLWFHERFGAASPNPSEWAQKFHIIAWPITHAVLSRELLTSFAQLLEGLTSSVRGCDDVTLDALLRDHSYRIGSARFHAFIAQSQLSRGLTRALISPDEAPAPLAASMMERLERAISEVRASRDALQNARARQEVLALSSGRLSRDATSVLGISWSGELHEPLSLSVTFFPDLSLDLGKMRALLRQSMYTPRLWGVSQRLTSSDLFEERPIALKLEQAPELEGPLFPRASDYPKFASLLEGFSLALEFPLIFKWTSYQAAVRITSSYLHPDARYIIVFQQGKLPTPPVGGKAGPELTGFPGLSCALIDTACAEVKTWAASVLKMSVPAAVAQVDVFGRPAWSSGVVVEGEPALARMKRGDTCSLWLLDERAGSGEYSLGDARAVVDAVSAPRHRRHCWLELDAGLGAVTVAAFLSRELSMRVESLLPVDELTLTLCARSDGYQRAISIKLPTLPTLISAAQLTQLIDEQLHDSISQTGRLELTASVSSLCRETWILEDPVLEYWWAPKSSGPIKWTALTEDGELPVSCVQSSELLLSCARQDTGVKAGEVALLLTSSSGDYLLEGGRCVGGGGLRLDRPRDLSARPLTRTRVSSRRALGADELERSYLAWSLASAQSHAVELFRRLAADRLEHALTRMLCGQRWADWEAHHYHAHSKNYWEDAVDLMWSRGVFGACEHQQAGERFKEELVASLFKTLGRFVEAELNADTLWDVTESILEKPAPELDEEGVIAFHDIDLLNEQLIPKIGAELRQRIGKSIRPTWLLSTDSTAQLVERLNRRDLSASELVELVKDCLSREHQALTSAKSSWSSEHVTSAVSLWLNPSIYLHSSCRREVLELSLSDRVASRIIRYCALRYRDAQRLKRAQERVRG